MDDSQGFFFPTITVASNPLPPPPGKKFAAEIVIFFGAFAQGVFTEHHVDILGIKDFDPKGQNLINEVTSDVGVATTDGFNIFWDALGADVDLNPLVTISWTQIPAPGSLALLGLAGLFGIPRRRRLQ